MVIAAFVILFAIFPLTDTDIWWHLACAREWVTTWTPVRTPVVNVHEYFQLLVGFVYGLGGAPLLVAFKAVLWGAVFALFLRRRPCHLELVSGSAFLALTIIPLFFFRYHFEMRPVLFSLLFLGIFWNVLPRLFANGRLTPVNTLLAVLVLAIQWTWCKVQGLYILGPLFAVLVLVAGIWNPCRAGDSPSRKALALRSAFVVALFAMPFLHKEGLNLFLYPFGLLDRLLGLSSSASIFASEIAENRSPFTLLMAGENTQESVLMILFCVAGMGFAFWQLYKARRPDILNVTLLITAILALVAELNFVLFLPVLLVTLPVPSKQLKLPTSFHIPRYSFTLVFLAFILGFWARSLSDYDYSMVAYQRVPVHAAAWMVKHPHVGKLFNDDRAGGYLALMNPADSIYIDGRFILKTADFFERYLDYAKDPVLFMHDADSLGIDRALFPLQYYARWDTLMQALQQDSRWHLAYRDEYFAVFDKILK